MRYLAVPEMPRRGWLVSLLRRNYWTPEWHAVADTSPTPTVTLCGSQYSSEAHWTWDQTMSGTRCPLCERLVPAPAELPSDEISSALEDHPGALLSRLRGRPLIGLAAAGTMIFVGV